MKNIIEKRIVIFNGSLQQGGAERVISILSRKMKEEGYQVEILLYYDREVFYDIHMDVKITVVERNTRSKNKLVNLVWMRKFFDNNADIVISFLAPFNIMALIAHIGLKSLIVVADRNDPRFIPKNKIIRKIRDFFYNFADGVIVQTTHNKKYFSNRIQKKSKVIFNPVDLKEKQGIALSCYKKKEIVSVGRIMPQKNQEMLIEAFAEIHKVYPEYFLIIYGDDSCLEQKERIKALIKKHSLEPYVSIPGNVKDVIDNISSSEIFVLSSNYEGMPNALIEAMCVGLPCISTKVSGATDLIQDGINGALVDIGDKGALINQMLKLIEDKKLRNQYAKNAVELNSRLNVDVIMKQWIRYIGEL